MAVAQRPPGEGSGRPNPSMVATYLAGGTANGALERRASRLGAALAGLAQELATAHREIAVLKRENTDLRSRLNAHDAAFRTDAPLTGDQAPSTPRGEWSNGHEHR